MLPKDKDRVVVEVVQRVLDSYGDDPIAVEHALFDTIYEERRRLDTEHDRKRAKKEGAFYNGIYREACRVAPDRQRVLLRKIIRSFSEEVAGHFDPRVYEISTRVIPPVLTVLLNTLSPLRLIESLPTGFATLDDSVEMRGETEALKKMAEIGTTVFVPTHSSNLDSIVVGFGLYSLGLPPYIYGAGLNLFANKLIGFFMHNLGAYKVDRRKKAKLYKDVLKQYAGCSMEAGYNNLFFPGGTRSRSGKVERKLKLGLLGRALDAYVHNLIAGKEKPDIFVVPATINYQLVLEAETLIADFLKDLGKSRYIIEDDEFSRPKRVLDFVQKLFSLNSRIQIVVGKPLDVFGNEVDADGFSRDSRGRRIDRTRYVQSNGGPGLDRQRDNEYTRELARAVSDSYVQNTVINSTHLVAFVVHSMLLQRNPDLDLYRLLRTGGRDESFLLPDVYDRADRLLIALRELAADDKLTLDDTLKRRDTVSVVSEALAHLATYHRVPAVKRRGDRLFHEDRNLLLFYQNRIEGLGLVDRGMLL